jgi:hypothetical protein
MSAKVGDRIIVNSCRSWRAGDTEGEHCFRVLAEITEVGEWNGSWRMIEVLGESGRPPDIMIVERGKMVKFPSDAPIEGGFAVRFFDDLVQSGRYEPVPA